MTGGIFPILDDLETAIEDDENARALSVLDDLGDAYDERAVEQRPRIERAKALARRTAGDVPEDLRSYLEHLAGVRFNRAGALISLRMTLVYSEQTDEQPLDLVETLRQRERALQGAADAVSNRVDEVSIPPFPAVEGIDAPARALGKGSTGAVTATILNAGDGALTGLSSTTAVPDGLELVDGPELPERLGPGASKEVTVTVRGAAVGDYTVSIHVSDDSGREGVDSALLEVLGKGGFVDRGQGHLDQLRTTVEDAAPPSGGLEQQLLSKIDAAEDSLSDADHRIERSKPKQANNRIKTASRQLGAFINAVEADGKGKGKSSLPESRRVTFVESASDTIDLLSAAQTAHI